MPVPHALTPHHRIPKIISGVLGGNGAGAESDASCFRRVSAHVGGAAQSPLARVSGHLTSEVSSAMPAQLLLSPPPSMPLSQHGGRGGKWQQGRHGAAVPTAVRRPATPHYAHRACSGLAMRAVAPWCAPRRGCAGFEPRLSGSNLKRITIWREAYQSWRRWPPNHGPRRARHVQAPRL